MWSNLEIERRVYIPAGKVKLGCFADVNCALAYLEQQRTPGWQKRRERLVELHQGQGAPIIPATQPWSLTHPQRVAPISACSQSAAEYLAEHAEKRNKRKREDDDDGGGDPLKEFCAEMEKRSRPKPPPPSGPMVNKRGIAAARIMDNDANHGKVKVALTDENQKRHVFYTDNWRAALQERLGFTLTHAMPMFVNAASNKYTILPLLECDGRHLSAADVKVEIMHGF